MTYANREDQYNVAKEESTLAEMTRHAMTEARKRRVDLEELAADLYQEKKDRGVDPEDLIDAMATIAAAFYSPTAVGAKDYSGETMDNDLQFQQRMALGNVVGNANWMAESAVKFLRDNDNRLAKQERYFDGSDNAIDQIIQTQDRIEVAKTLQVPHCAEYLQIVAAAYRGVIGESWKPRAKQGAGEREQRLAALKERTQRLRG